jgi:hypothetical protein
MSLMGIAKFERFFRVADVDKSDLRRYSDFVNGKIYDLLLRGQAAAKANGRVIIEPFDPPITKGLQESIHEFRNIDEQIELKPILDHLAGAALVELLAAVTAAEPVIALRRALRPMPDGR